MSVLSVVSNASKRKLRGRVRGAEATLSRVRSQQERFATEYGAATTAQERFAAAVNAVRAAAAPGRHQPDHDDVASQLDRLTRTLTTVLDQLHKAQEDRANKTIRACQRQIERDERTVRQ